MNENIYNWSFDSSKNRWSLWYIIALSVLIWLVIWSFLTKQYILWFLVILMSWVYFFIENNSNEEIKVSINELWIKVDNNFYDFAKINYFTVIYEDDFAKVLRIYLDNKITNKLDLKIDNNIIIDIYPILKEKIQENTYWWYTIIDKIVNLLKL